MAGVWPARATTASSASTTSARARPNVSLEGQGEYLPPGVCAGRPPAGFGRPRRRRPHLVGRHGHVRSRPAGKPPRRRQRCLEPGRHDHRRRQPRRHHLPVRRQRQAAPDAEEPGLRRRLHDVHARQQGAALYAGAKWPPQRAAARDRRPALPGAPARCACRPASTTTSCCMAASRATASWPPPVAANNDET